MKERKKKNLTREEKRLLTYPPTEGTWICTSCSYGIINGQKNQTCFVCGSVKPKKPFLLWPRYIKACEKLGIAPGTKVRWHRNLNKPMIFNGNSYRFLEESDKDHPIVKEMVKKQNEKANKSRRIKRKSRT